MLENKQLFVMKHTFFFFFFLGGGGITCTSFSYVQTNT